MQCTVATLNTATLEALGLFRGDTIICRGKKRKDTVLIVLQSDEVDEGKVQLNKGKSHSPCTAVWTRSLTLARTLALAVARHNLRVKLGDVITIHACQDIKYGKRIHVLPFDDSIEGGCSQLPSMRAQVC